MKNRIENTKAKNRGVPKAVVLTQQQVGGSGHRPCKITLHISRCVARRLEKYLAWVNPKMLLDEFHRSIYEATKKVELTLEEYKSFAVEAREQEKEEKRRRVSKVRAS